MLQIKKSERGQGLVEYGLVLTLVAVVVIIVLCGVGLFALLSGGVAATWLVNNWEAIQSGSVRHIFGAVCAGFVVLVALGLLLRMFVFRRR